MSTKIVLTDANEIISKKILINRMSIQYLEHETQYALTLIKLQALIVKKAKDKTKLIEDLNALFEQQLKIFDENRQDECMTLYEHINEMDLPSKEFIDITKKLDNIKNDMIALSRQIDYIESVIPTTKQITNYVIKDKSSSNTSCHDRDPLL